MAQVTLRINGYAHALACADGEEAHLKAMGGEIDARISALRQAGMAGGEARMLVVAALQLADELADARRALAAASAAAPVAPAAEAAGPAGPDPAAQRLAETVAELAARIGRVAARLDEAHLETTGESA